MTSFQRRVLRASFQSLIASFVFVASVWGQAPLALSTNGLPYMGNGGLEKDQRGRLPFWGEEKVETILPGQRSGRFQPDETIKREGQTSALVVASNDWFAVSSVNYPVARWTGHHQLSAWAKCDQDAAAQIVVCWNDDLQKTIRTDAGPIVRGAEWQPLTMAADAPPEAASLRLVLVAQHGRVWFDECQLIRAAPQQRRVSIFVNQVGYDVGLPKSAVIAANFFPTDLNSIKIELQHEDGGRAMPKEVRGGSRIGGDSKDDWGWYFWRAEFSDLRRAGRYRVMATIGDAHGESVPFQLAQGFPLAGSAREAVDFFYIQRCGFAVPGWHEACHLDDATLSNKTHVDVVGGWHSAGDYNKLMYEHGDGGVVFALLAAARAAPKLFDRLDRDGDGISDVLAEAAWGAQFVAKMQIPESGALRNHVHQGPGRNWTKWSAPEVHTDNKIGTEDDPVFAEGVGNSPLVIGAWAELSGLRDRLGFTNDYRQAALRLWNHATQGGTNAGSAHLLLSTLELHRVLGEKTYLDYARRSAEQLLSQQTNGVESGAFGAYGEFTAAALASFALAYPRDPLLAKIVPALREYAGFCARSAENPFGLSKRVLGPGAHFFPSDLGHNFQILSRAWAAALVYRATGDQRALTYAVDHVDWVLGKNPENLCMFEGQGSVNPPRYHHRYNAIPGHERGAVPGAIPNGFVQDMGLADRPGFDLSRGGNRAPSFRTSEPWLVHNLFYLLAASELYRAGVGE